MEGMVCEIKYFAYKKQTEKTCRKGVPNCKCLVGFKSEEQCPDCREDCDRDSRCICPPKECDNENKK